MPRALEPTSSPSWQKSVFLKMAYMNSDFSTHYAAFNARLLCNSLRALRPSPPASPEFRFMLILLACFMMDLVIFLHIPY